MSKRKKIEPLEIDLGIKDADTAAAVSEAPESEASQVTITSRTNRLQMRQKAEQGKALYVTVSTDTYKLLRAYVVEHADDGGGKCNKSTVTEQALIEFFNRRDTTV